MVESLRQPIHSLNALLQSKRHKRHQAHGMGVGQHEALPHTGQQAILHLLIKRGISLDLKVIVFGCH
ncbi:hypothetical protein BGP_2325 [Beggiatoa sp. PS]|nr:hypothetical protein BGP_2325 [Beggiatoa sp. PS]